MGEFWGRWRRRVRWNTTRHTIESMTLDMTKRFRALELVGPCPSALTPTVVAPFTAPPPRVKPILRILPASSAIHPSFWTNGSLLGVDSALVVGPVRWNPSGNSGQEKVM